MNKKITFLPILLAVFLSPVYAQMFGDIAYDDAGTVVGVDYDRGFTAQIETRSNLFQMTDVRWSDAAERVNRTNYLLFNNFPFGGTNVLDGTVVRFGYNAERFGGAFSVNQNGIDGVKAWAQFFNNRLRITAGTDIGYSFANTQDAPAGLRVYDDHVRNIGEGEAENPTVDSNKTPDDITRGRGVLLEIFLDPITIAIAGGGDLADMGRVLMLRNTNNPWGQVATFGHTIHYGINIGGRIGDIARINAAYIFESNKDETQFTHNSALDAVIATRADAHVMTHQFGLFGSVYPFRNDSLGITLGYAGVLVRYLDEFGVGSRTVMPQVLKHGINLAARYSLGDLTLRMDFNYSFWIDRNYRIFQLHRPHVDLRDWGLVSSATVADRWGDVRHSFFWAGLGASYNFTDALAGSISARNLLRIDETSELRMLNNYFAVELRSTFKFGSSVEAFLGVVFDLTTRSINETLSAQVGEFAPAFTARDISDTRFVVQIPMGLTVRLQRDLGRQ